ncbi:MAG: MFS transporter [Christensenellaceae bacterium]|jgi:MFS family permease|nr:MFS transporter [Christensenellaceae bacterium]
MRKALAQGLNRHPLFQTLLALRGNPRICVFTEPLWAIPNNLYAPYATLFMFQLGVSDAQIGWILSIGMVCQAIAALLGGVLSDKFGRRRTTFVADLLAWSLPCLIWAFSQNAAWFLAAAVVNSLWQVTATSWSCLLVEDCDPRQLVHVYTWCTVAGLLAVFFAPVSGVLVGRFTLIPVMRGLYLLSFFMMTAKFLLLYLCGTETAQGALRVQQTKGIGLFSLTLEYRGVLKAIFRSKPVLVALSVMVLLNITSFLSSSFFALYIVNDLGVPEGLVTAFPMVRAAVMLFFFFAVPGGGRAHFRRNMALGLGLYLLAQVLLLLAPKGGGSGAFAALGAYILLEAVGGAVVVPRKDSLVALFVDPNERARMMGMLTVIMLACSTPFGWIGGQLSALNRMLPFALNFLLYLGCAALVLCSKAVRGQDEALHD